MLIFTIGAISFIFTWSKLYYFWSKCIIFWSKLYHFWSKYPIFWSKLHYFWSKNITLLYNIGKKNIKIRILKILSYQHS